MLELDGEWLRDTITVLPPLLLSLTLHEYAHARTALAFGDPTARNMGRVSLNPLRHLDFLGTLMLIFSGLIGWAKPVPVNPFNLYPRRLGDIAVSVAGPATNFALAVISGLLLRVWIAKGPAEPESLFDTGYILLYWTTVANLGMCFFNLLPLFPLDGHHILRELLPPRYHAGFMHWQMRFGSMLLLAMIFGPRLVQVVTGRALPVEPLRLYLRGVIRPILNLLIGG